jgi:hypothetical protein
MEHLARAIYHIALNDEKSPTNCSKPDLSSIHALLQRTINVFNELLPFLSFVHATVKHNNIGLERVG